MRPKRSQGPKAYTSEYSAFPISSYRKPSNLSSQLHSHSCDDGDPLEMGDRNGENGETRSPYLDPRVQPFSPDLESNDAVVVRRENSKRSFKLPTKKYFNEKEPTEDNLSAKNMDDGTVKSEATASATASKSASRASENTGTAVTADSTLQINRGLLARCLTVIPFTVLVVLLLMIPIGFLVVYSSIVFAAHAQTLRYVNGHYTFINYLVHCEAGLRKERAGSTFVLLANTTERWTDLQAHRAETDKYFILILDEMLQSGNEKIRTTFLRQIDSMQEDLAVVRHEVGERSVTPMEVRKRYSDFMWVMNSGLSLVATHSSVVDKFVVIQQLKLVHQSLNHFTVCEAVGAEILLRHSANETVSYSLASEMYNCLDQTILAITELKMVDLEAQSKLLIETVESDPHVARALAMMDALSMNPNEPQPFTLPEFLSTIHDGLEDWEARSDEDVFIGSLKGAARSNLITELFKLIAAMVGCLISMWLIVRSNMLAQQRIDVTLAKSRRMQHAVQKFVPKNFLRLCGCTSILHVEAGDQTEVAVSMLHCTIRNFSTVSAKMTNEKLFEWLQSYFRRMTGITETRHGFIDRFTGDDIFAVFTSASNTVTCAIDIQTSVGMLNRDIIAAKNRDVLNVGVAVHHGIASAGFLGDANRLTVSLISTETLVPSKLEFISRRYGCRIVASQQAIDQVSKVDNFELRYLGQIQPPGFTEPIGLYDVFQTDALDMKIYKSNSKEIFEEAVELRRLGKVAKSNMLFERCEAMATSVDLDDQAIRMKLSHEENIDYFAE